MYDFNFGTKEQIHEEPEKFLLFVKRLMPRWVNGIPDSEAVAVFRTLEGLRGKDVVLVETGSGASSLILFLHCALYGGKFYSWDTNVSKGAFLRSVISDAIGRVLEVDVHKVWKFVGFDSINPHVGIPVLRELGEKIDFGFFDSWHTLDHLMNEIRAFESVASDRFILALDDAYYRKRSENYSYVNMLRNKLGLAPVEEPDSNVCEPFHVEVEGYLKKIYPEVIEVESSYKVDFERDVFFEYYAGDRSFMNAMGMEEKENLGQRYKAWKVRSLI